MRPEVSTITDLLRRSNAGDPRALEELFPRVYRELHHIAAGRMRKERADHTLQATALVNEAFMRLVDGVKVEWQGSTHFFATAARLMRQILVDHARARKAAKRGGAPARVDFDENLVAAPEAHPDLLALDRCLKELALSSERQCRVVEMRYFGGLTIEEIAMSLECSTDTVKRDWKKARVWLLNRLRSAGQSDVG